MYYSIAKINISDVLSKDMHLYESSDQWIIVKVHIQCCMQRSYTVLERWSIMCPWCTKREALPFQY